MSYSVHPFLPRLLDVPTLVVVAERDDLTLWDLEIEAYNLIPTTKKRLVVIGELDAHDALQRPVAADAGGAGRHRVVHGESRGTEARWSGMIDTAEPGRVRAEEGGSA